MTHSTHPHRILYTATYVSFLFLYLVPVNIYKTQTDLTEPYAAANMEAKIVRTFALSDVRVLSVDSDDDVFIRDEVNIHKKAFFTGKRFVRFCLTMQDINRDVEKARDGKEISAKVHLGGGWYISLTAGFSCVDLRKFYQHDDNSIRPTKLGIALNYSEWDALIQAATAIYNELDGMKAISSCWHNTVDEERECSECTPFKPIDSAT